MINGKIGQTTKLSLCARKEKSSHCTLVLPRNSSTFLSFTFPRIKTRLSRAQDACRSRKSRSQTLRGQSAKTADWLVDNDVDGLFCVTAHAQTREN